MAKTSSKTGKRLRRLSKIEKYILDKNPENLTADGLAELLGRSVKSIKKLMAVTINNRVGAETKTPIATGVVHEGEAVIILPSVKSEAPKNQSANETEHKDPNHPREKRAAVMTPQMSELQDDMSVRDALNPHSGFQGNKDNFHVIRKDKPTM